MSYNEEKCTLNRSGFNCIVKYRTLKVCKSRVQKYHHDEMKNDKQARGVNMEYRTRIQSEPYAKDAQSCHQNCSIDKLRAKEVKNRHWKGPAY